MNIKDGMIVKNLIPTEPVVINKVQSLGRMFSVTYTGVRTKKSDSRVIDKSTLESLRVITEEGEFTFKGNPVHFLLFAEAERIFSAYQFDPLFAVNCSIVDPLPHQIEAVYKYLLPQPKIRFLLADDTGAGKTIMTGLLLKELMMRGFVERILVITPGGLTRQWQEDEMGLKFNISFKLVNRATFQAEPSIFSHSPRLITSIDFLRGEDVLNVVKETAWDIIVVDEAHKLSAFDYGQKKYESMRYKVLESLASRCDHLLLLTATPHRGRKDTFRNLLQLLDKDIFATDSQVTSRVQAIGETGVNKFFIRRLKEEMKGWDGKKLFKDRFTRTVLYELTPEEKHLYDEVTAYLSEKRQEARRDSNIHVSLALMVMQRRLTSSIYAIMRTLKNRYNALKGLLEELSRNPDLWRQKQKLDGLMDSLDDFDEWSDEERESLERLCADPRKFKLFTTAKSPAEIREEAEQVKELVDMAESLYRINQEEHKFTKLRELLKNEGVLDKSEKLVIFTEHKDTLDYLEQRLRNNGYSISTIHGGKSVDERRDAQLHFAREAQILIATDAAGEGINLQFCRLLINWDIPWNPNRLEQRMGRIHRYGQKNDVIVFNMVAGNTCEGKVLKNLLAKLDLIREQLGDDRVYDVISDIFEDVPLDDIIRAIFNGEDTPYTQAIETRFDPELFRSKIQQQKLALGTSSVDYSSARDLKESSDEKRLQPIYIRLFFEKAFKELGGRYTELRKNIYRIDELPDSFSRVLKDDYNIPPDIARILFCFDKDVFLTYQELPDLGKVHYINPGNVVFDSLVKVVRNLYKEDMLMGTHLISPDDPHDFFAFYVKSQITDNRPHKELDSVVDERLLMVVHRPSSAAGPQFCTTSPARFIDLHPPKEFVKVTLPPTRPDSTTLRVWCFDNITEPQFQQACETVTADTEKRKEYLEESFRNAIFDITAEINELQGKLLLGNKAVQDKITAKQEQIKALEKRKKERLQKLEFMLQLNMKPPEVLGCAYVQALTNLEYRDAFGMSRDDEVEAVAMETAMNYEREQGRTPEDVSDQNAGYDIRSVDPNQVKRYIEVKGRSGEDGVMLSENEMNRLAQLAESAWLYIVADCKTHPRLFTFDDPAKNLSFERTVKGIQYYLPLHEWKKNMP